MLYFRLFCKKISKQCGKFKRFGRKTQLFWAVLESFDNFDEKSIEKWHIYRFSGKFCCEKSNLCE